MYVYEYIANVFECKVKDRQKRLNSYKVILFSDLQYYNYLSHILCKIVLVGIFLSHVL